MKKDPKKRKWWQFILRKLIIHITPLLISVLAALILIVLKKQNNDYFIIRYEQKEIKDILTSVVQNQFNNDTTLFLSEVPDDNIAKSFNNIYNNVKLGHADLFDLIYFLKQFDPQINKVLKHGTLRTDDYLEAFAFGLLVWFVAAVFLFVLVDMRDIKNKVYTSTKEAINDWEDQRIHLVNDNFIQVIEKFTEYHKTVFAGIYRNYPRSYDSKIAQLDFDKPDFKGVSFWIPNCDVNHYSKLARKLFSETKKSFHSTIYISNNKFLKYNEPGEDIINWLICQKKRKDLYSPIEFKRTHVFNSKIKTQSLNSFKKIIDRYKSKPIDQKINKYKGLMNYLYFGVNPNFCDSYNIYEIDNNTDVRYFGEYMIFDKEVLLIYDDELKVLKIICGEIVLEYLKPFDDDDINSKKIVKDLFDEENSANVFESDQYLALKDESIRLYEEKFNT